MATHRVSNVRSPGAAQVDYMRTLRRKRVALARRRDRKAFDAFQTRQIERLTSA